MIILTKWVLQIKTLNLHYRYLIIDQNLELKPDKQTPDKHFLNLDFLITVKYPLLD